MGANFAKCDRNYPNPFLSHFPAFLNHERTRKHVTQLDAQDRRSPAEERNRAYHPAWPPWCGCHPAARVHLADFAGDRRNPSVLEHDFSGANDGQKSHSADSTALGTTAAARSEI